MPRNDRTSDNSAAQLGLAVRAAREAAGVTQQEAALRADMDRAYLSEVENGKRSISVDRLLRLCASLNVRASAIIAQLEENVARKLVDGSKRSQR